MVGRTINLRVKDKENKTLLSFELEYESKEDLEQALSSAMPFLLIKGILTIECNTLNWNINGIEVGKNANVERSERYRKTGN